MHNILRSFEREIADAFIAKKIGCPIHLSDGNEEQLIEVFKSIHPEDWVLSNWRSHYHAILHGVSLDRLKKDIFDGKSMHLNYPENRFVASSIVGGTLPIALGLAMATDRHVWCFLGDTTAEMGTFHECVKYAENFKLPVTYVVEDNKTCITATTCSLWGKPDEKPENTMPKRISSCVMRYSYIKSVYPHTGADQWVQFT